MKSSIKRIAFIASALPVFLTVYLAVRYYVIVPVWDDWDSSLLWTNSPRGHSHSKTFSPFTTSTGSSSRGPSCWASRP